MTEDLRSRLGVLARDMNAVELGIVVEIAERLVRVGRAQYGPMPLEDGRDNAHEAFEELLDGCVYLAREVRALRRPRRWWARR